MTVARPRKRTPPLTPARAARAERVIAALVRLWPAPFGLTPNPLTRFLEAVVGGSWQALTYAASAVFCKDRDHELRHIRGKASSGASAARRTREPFYG